MSECFPNKNKPFTGEFVYRQAKALSEHCKVVMIVPLRYMPGREILTGDSEGLFKNFNNWLSGIKDTSDYSEGNLRVIYFGYISLPRPFFESADNTFINFFFYNKLKKLITEQNPDLIYCNWIRPWAPVTAGITKELNIPFVIDHHEDIPTLKKLFPDKASQFLQVFKSADKIIVHSGLNKKQLVNEKLTEREIKVIHLGQNFDVSITEKYFDNSNLRLICVSHLTEKRKNIDVLIKAVSLLDKKIDFELTVIGDGVFKNEYMDLATSVGQKEKVFFKGALSHEDIGAELDVSDIFILPSFPEAFGIVMTEALAKGVPVISCHGNGGAEELKALGYPVILVPPENEYELAKAIEDLSNNRSEMKEMSEKGKIIVSDNFTWDMNGISTYKFLDNTLRNFINKMISRK
ncbi:MAG TPA: glycosyltransferase family 4 protein [Ignavibacteria bacterium]|nr:glycosyltransferase family 4 protein [Ignavibacteria bacterium]HQY53040.1 glycosyltransferase family 4 protein [Ignavibacteria bacterium]